jgi:hypothetical protein
VADTTLLSEPKPREGIDPGAPFELGDQPEPAKETPKPAEKSPEAKRIEELEAQLKNTGKRVEELAASEKYWAERAKAQPAAEREEPEPRRAAPAEEEKPEKFLDDLSVKGVKALRERGVITQDEFEARLEQIETKLEGRIALQQRHNALDTELGKFGPDLKDPNSPLFQHTQMHFRQMVADDPAMQNSPAALLSAARIAKRELELEAKLADTEKNGRGESRRERVERQMGDRPGPGAIEEDADDDLLSPEARAIVANLSKHMEVRGKDGKVTISAEDNYRRHRERG